MKKDYTISNDEAGLRLDRILRRIMPDLPVSLFQKLIRKKAIKLNEHKTEGKTKVCQGDIITFPDDLKSLPVKPKPPSLEKQAFLKSLILYEDHQIMVLNKPFGLAVQGGSRINYHLDGLLANLADENGHKPHLVHRLDKDTTGVMILAKTANSAAKFAQGFKEHKIKKRYWAVVCGVPKISSGKIALNLEKGQSTKGEIIMPNQEGKRAVTFYRVISQAGNLASWLELWPLTGRKHQIRVHLSAIGNPIIGDPKYNQIDLTEQITPKLHLHARAIKISGIGLPELEITAPIPEHFKATFNLLGFDETMADHNPFPIE